MKPATDRQKAFIKSICEALEIKEPENLTIQEASDFISSHIEDFEQEQFNSHYMGVDMWGN